MSYRFVERGAGGATLILRRTPRGIIEALRVVEDRSSAWTSSSWAPGTTSPSRGREATRHESLTSMGSPRLARCSSSRPPRPWPRWTGSRNVESELTWYLRWSPEKMSDDAKFVFGFGSASPIFRTTLPNCSPLSRCSCAAAASLSGTRGRRSASLARARRGRRRPRSRSRVPIVDPRIESCFHQMRWSCAGGFGPLVAPQTTIRPSSPPPATRSSRSPHRRARRRRRRRDRRSLPSQWPPHRRSRGSRPRRRRTRAPARASRRSTRSRSPGRREPSRGRAPPRRRRRRAPDEHPLAFLEFRARDQHPVGGLEDEREGSGLLEGEVVGKGRTYVCRHGDELRVSPVGVLADDVAPSSRPGLITTSSPVAKPSVPSPSASTTPAPSAPRMRGSGRRAGPGASRCPGG